LILDEPTAGLDPNQIREVRNTMRKLGETIACRDHPRQSFGWWATASGASGRSNVVAALVTHTPSFIDSCQYMTALQALRTSRD